MPIGTRNMLNAPKTNAVFTSINRFLRYVNWRHILDSRYMTPELLSYFQHTSWSDRARFKVAALLSPEAFLCFERGMIQIRASNMQQVFSFGVQLCAISISIRKYRQLNNMSTAAIWNETQSYVRSMQSRVIEVYACRRQHDRGDAHGSLPFVEARMAIYESRGNTGILLRKHVLCGWKMIGSILQAYSFIPCVSNSFSEPVLTLFV